MVVTRSELSSLTACRHGPPGARLGTGENVIAIIMHVYETAIAASGGFNGASTGSAALSSAGSHEAGTTQTAVLMQLLTERTTRSSHLAQQHEETTVQTLMSSTGHAVPALSLSVSLRTKFPFSKLETCFQSFGSSLGS